jgi:hypothetical protein
MVGRDLAHCQALLCLGLAQCAQGLKHYQAPFWACFFQKKKKKDNKSFLDTLKIDLERVMKFKLRL